MPKTKFQNIIFTLIMAFIIAEVCNFLRKFKAFCVGKIGNWHLRKSVLYGDETAGFPTLIIVMLFLGGIQQNNPFV